MTDMKATFSIVLVLLALGSFGIEVPALPQSEFADAEVSPRIRDSLAVHRPILESRQGDAARAWRL